MKTSTALGCILVGLMLALTGCAKPPIRNYPRTTTHDASSRPAPRVSSRPETDGKRPAPRTEGPAPVAVPTAPPPTYDKPLTPIGTPQKKEPSTGDDYLLAAIAPLADQASDQLASGDLDRAQTTAERAVRIDPSNADLWHLMGKIQMARENFSQAEQLARKSNLLAGENANLKARNWRMIAESLRRRGNTSAAEEAVRKARELESR